MKCPDCQNELKVSPLKGLSIYECVKCRGKWFERDQLMLAKDKADDGLRWLDFDPFGHDARQLSIMSDGKQCPCCTQNMQSLTYSESKIVIDKCPSCQGVWMSHGELARIIRYLEKIVDTESVKDLRKDTFKEFIKIFTGQKGVVSEVKDFLAVLNILETRIAVEHPHLAQSWMSIKANSPYK